MKLLRLTLIVPTLVIAVSGCGSYDPPIRGDRTSERYRTDLEACRTTASHNAYLQTAGDPGSWILSPITNPPKVRAGIRACMTGKGYTLQNTAG